MYVQCSVTHRMTEQARQKMMDFIQSRGLAKKHEMEELLANDWAQHAAKGVVLPATVRRCFLMQHYDYLVSCCILLITTTSGFQTATRPIAIPHVHCAIPLWESINEADGLSLTLPSLTSSSNRSSGSSMKMRGKRWDENSSDC